MRGTRQGIGLSHRGDIAVADASKLRAIGTLLCPPFVRKGGRGFRRRLAMVRAGSPDPPVLCDRRSPSPRPSARHLETLAERNKFATKAAGIRGRSRPTLQHASPAPPPARAEVWHERAMARRLELSGKFAPAERPKWRAESSQPCPKTTSGSVVIDAISSWGSRPGGPARSSPVPGAQPN